MRITAGLKQSELAVALHTTQRKISYWETGKVQPDLEELCIIAAYFDISVDDLLCKEV